MVDHKSIPLTGISQSSQDTNCLISHESEVQIFRILCPKAVLCTSKYPDTEEPLAESESI